MAAPLLGAIRSRLVSQPQPDNSRQALRLTLMGNPLTWKTLYRETGEQSPLGKEIGEQLWVVDSMAGLPQVVRWLTGGDCNLVSYIKNRLDWERLTEDPIQALRRVIHELVAEMGSEDSSESLESRLRWLIGLQRNPDDSLSEHEQSLIRALYTELYALLPGTFGPDDDGAAYQWYQRRRHARWLPFPLLNWRQRFLILGGLVRFDADDGEDWRRLRSPLLAYVVARHGMQSGRWTPGASSVMRTGVMGRMEWPVRASVADGLDHFLDAYLDKATTTPDKDSENDHWTAARPGQTPVLNGTPPGHWWERVDYQDLPEWE